jgi:hypothetical protein
VELYDFSQGKRVQVIFVRAFTLQFTSRKAGVAAPLANPVAFLACSLPKVNDPFPPVPDKERN